MASLFKCQTCHKEFSAEHVLEAHLEDWKYRERLFALARERCRVHCDPDDEADYEQSEPLKADQCPSEPCGMKFSSTSNVKRHFRKHVQALHMCPCGANFFDLDLFARHDCKLSKSRESQKAHNEAVKLANRKYTWAVGRRITLQLHESEEVNTKKRRLSQDTSEKRAKIRMDATETTNLPLSAQAIMSQAMPEIMDSYNINGNDLMVEQSGSNLVTGSSLGLENGIARQYSSMLKMNDGTTVWDLQDGNVQHYFEPANE